MAPCVMIGEQAVAAINAAVDALTETARGAVPVKRQTTVRSLKTASRVQDIVESNRRDRRRL